MSIPGVKIALVFDLQCHASMSLESCQCAISKNIKRPRAARGLNQSEVAMGAGIPYRYYQEIEGSRVNLTLKTLHKLAHFFKLRMSKLVHGC